MSSQFISGFFDSKLPAEFLARGRYNVHNHGGACQWVITQGPLPATTPADNFSIPYHGEKFMYIFSFYQGIGDIDDDEKKEKRRLEPMWQFMTALCKKSSQATEAVEANAHEYVLLTNERLEKYNEKEECLDAVLSTGPDCIDQDEFGGMICFADLLAKEK